MLGHGCKANLQRQRYPVPARMEAIGLVVTITAVCAIGLNYVPEMMLANPNSGISRRAPKTVRPLFSA
jgi:hypothetical protein